MPKILHSKGQQVKLYYLGKFWRSNIPQIEIKNYVQIRVY